MELLNKLVLVSILGLILSELIFRSLREWKQGMKLHVWRDVTVNLMIGSIDRVVTGLFWTVLMFAGFRFVHEHFALFSFSMDNWWAWPLAIILSDFAYYCYHRAGHEVRFFWAIHNVHHSSEQYNFSTSVRLSWMEGCFRWPFWIILPLVGFTAEVSMVAYLLIRLYQVLLHTEAVRTLGWLEYIMSTPSAHRVHHGRNPQYLDKNYGGVTVLWDRLFRTYAKEEEKVDYGLVHQLKSENIVWINFHEYVKLAADLRSARNLREVLGYLFLPPGWTPVRNEAEECLREAFAWPGRRVG